MRGKVRETGCDLVLDLIGGKSGACFFWTNRMAK